MARKTEKCYEVFYKLRDVILGMRRWKIVKKIS